MPSALKVLIVDDEPNIRKMLSACLNADGHTVVTASNSQDAILQCSRQPFDMAFVDLRLGTEQGLDLIPKLLAESAWMRIVVITAFATVDTAVEAMRRGATDYLPKPFTPAQVRIAVERIATVRALEQRIAGLEGSDSQQIELNSNNATMRQAIELARQVADSEATVLIRGESGTGKGIFARAIHGWSKRSAKPFSTVSCPAISPQLLESELFGHVRGAFTGAIRDNPGRLAMSESGTLFLDEIGDLPLGLQPKLLRFVQDREYERVGDSVTRVADVRLISATNINLEQAVREGKFREDLLYRINVIQIDLPPLRQRPEDLQPLAQSMLAFFSRGKPMRGFSAEALAALQSYTWPGNVRELRNVIERAVILTRGDEVGLDHLPAGIAATHGGEPKLGDPVPLEAIEAVHLRKLMATGISVEDAAHALQMDTATLWRKRKKHGI
jgi:NtrC-family two-component system response regulator AlgB